MVEKKIMNLHIGQPMKLLLSLLTATACHAADIQLPPPNILNQGDAAPAFTWKVEKIAGKNYVSLAQVQKFYRFDDLVRDGESITLNSKDFTAKFSNGSHKAHFNGVMFYLSHAILTREGGVNAYLSQLDLTTFVDPLLRPDVQKMPPMKTVIIDPGHGGKDKGSAALESKYTLSLALQLRDELKKKGYDVILTREQNVFVSLADRVRMANATADAIFISLHFNAGNKNARGFESFIMSARQPRETHAASLALATAVHSRCLLHLNDKRRGKDFRIADRGIKRARFNVLSDCKHPAVIIEAGFLTHKDEAEKIKSAAYQKRLSNAIVRGVDVYQRSLKK